jgi:hypothetical protein
VLAHALTGAACVQLFERYPLAVTPHAAGTGYRSLVLLSRAGGPPSFFVLTQASDDLFVIRSWHRGGGVNQQIRPGEPVPVIVRQAVTGGIPVPRDGTLLGWVTGRQVTVMMAVHSRQPETWDDPVPVPEIRVLPLAGTCEPLHWPPFTAGPLDDGRLWEYLERVLGAVRGPAQRPARGRLHRGHRQPADPGLLAGGRRLHRSLDAPRGHHAAARRPPAGPARRGGSRLAALGTRPSGSRCK